MIKVQSNKFPMYRKPKNSANQDKKLFDIEQEMFYTLTSKLACNQEQLTWLVTSEW